MTLGLHHLEVQVVALAGALADAGEHRVAAELLADVVDELHQEHGLADAGAAEQADLAAAAVGGEQVDDLDARHQHLDLGALLDEGRGGAVDRAELGGVDRALLVDGIADDVHDAPEHALADRHLDRLVGVAHVHAADQAVGGVHGDGSDHALAEVQRRPRG
jgi:hypothetical protein